MHGDSQIFLYIFLIFTGAAIMATLALYLRQSLLIAHIALGMVIGPSGLALVTDTALISDVAHEGIVFLLFMLGLNLQPRNLLDMLKQTTLITVLSSTLFAAMGTLIGLIFGFSWWESLIMGASAMFSSTILGLKLLPTTVLHHRRTGEILVSILLLQDLLAILVLLLIQGGGGTENSALMEILKLLLALPLFILLNWAMSRYLLLKLIGRFDKIHEYIFLMTIGWCLGMSQLAAYFGLSHEIGAFIAESQVGCVRRVFLRRNAPYLNIKMVRYAIANAP